MQLVGLLGCLHRYCLSLPEGYCINGFPQMILLSKKVSVFLHVVSVVRIENHSVMFLHVITMPYGFGPFSDPFLVYATLARLIFCDVECLEKRNSMVARAFPLLYLLVFVEGYE